MNTFHKTTLSIVLFLILFLSGLTQSFAQLVGPQLILNVSGTTITATLSNIEPSKQAGIKIFISEIQFPLLPYCSPTPNPIFCSESTQPTKEIVGTTLQWKLTKGIKGKTTYYIRAEGADGHLYNPTPSWVVTGLDTIDTKWPLDYKTSGDSAWISGQINNASPSDFGQTILQYSRLPFEGAEATNEALPAEATPVPAQREESANSTLGVGPDGKYGFKLVNLSPNTVYYVKQIIKSTSRGVTEIKVDKFNSTKGYVPDNSADAAADYNKRTYRLLAPLPGLTVLFDQDLCREYLAEGKPVPGGDCDNQLSNFINLLIKIIIGLAAIVLVVQLIIQGYVYMVTDVPFLKAGAKSRFFDALFGLVLAMASYLILNTINPRLVSGTLNVAGVDVGVIAEFDIAGPLSGSFDGKPIKVNFNKEAYPAAKIASEKTGVSTAFILAIFAQETGSGSNVGKCRWTDAAANMYPADKPAFQTITSELGKNTNETPLSCALKKSDGSFNGHGGAIGYTQVLPTTWLAQRLEAKGYLGHMPSPWNTGDALMVTAIYLKKNGGVANQREAACKYYAGPGNNCSTNAGIGKYGDEVMGKKLSLEKQIAASIAKGDIK